MNKPTEADSLSDETRAESSNGGGVAVTNSRPKRKRAYHRALKRREPWAIIESVMRRGMQLMEDQYLRPSKEPSQFVSLLSQLEKK